MKRALLSLVLLGCSHPAVESRARVLPAVGKSQAPSEHPLVVGENIPRFGCLGTSAAHDMVVCAVGVSGLGTAANVTLAFASLAPGVESADSIVLLEDGTDVGSREQTRLEPPTRAKVASALSGFVTWEPASTLAPCRGASCEHIV